MILIDLLQKHIASADQNQYEGDYQMSSLERKEMRELVALLALNNIWTIKDLADRLKN